MDWIVYFIMFILGAISMFMMVCIGYAAKQEEPVNRVHFYVARDKYDKLWLYIGKPIRDVVGFHGDLDKGIFIMTRYNFKCFGLNENDYKNLKWEDEPLEVFVNMEE